MIMAYMCFTLLIRGTVSPGADTGFIKRGDLDPRYAKSWRGVCCLLQARSEKWGERGGGGGGGRLLGGRGGRYLI